MDFINFYNEDETFRKIELNKLNKLNPEYFIKIFKNELVHQLPTAIFQEVGF